MVRYNSIRYAPLGTKPSTTSWASKQRVGFLVLAFFIAIAVSIASYAESTLPVVQNDFPTEPFSPTITTTVTGTGRPTPTADRLLKPTRWSFDSQRDSNDYGLSASQCDLAFQPLFEEISRAASFARNNGGASPADLNISWTKQGAIRALIQDRQLYILSTTELESGHLLPRAIAILQSIYRAILTSPNPVPNIEFSFSVSDYADPNHVNKTIWALTRLASEESTWLMSDFAYFSWPMNGLIGSYATVRSRISEREPAWKDKIDKAVWRGSVKPNKARQDLINAAEGKDWSDVRGIEWSSAKSLMKASQKYAVSVVDHCAYKYLIGTEGRSYSGRLKYLQNCHSTLLMPPPTWIEPHHSLLVSSGSKQNFVPLNQNYSDLDEKMKDLLATPEKARLIADNAVKTFKDGVLTPAAQTCYWRRMFREWRDISFEPDADAWKTGTPFETWIIEAHETCSWFQHFRGKC
ncbi:hypothetical protein EG328_001672 [Venturia inaequalis]|uniref:Glycosyl transferase CAP10 domain-containing protein n=1 Tax=Venturia inaequalis TaxID=5025 RepID=A0A8H3UYN0_VENIN|nr:hypothetical protein EG328_001672 [Venturia inaequalis]